MNLIKIGTIGQHREILINLDRAFQIDIMEDVIIFYDKDCHPESHSMVILRGDGSWNGFGTSRFNVDEETFLNLKKYLENLTVEISNK